MVVVRYCRVEETTTPLRLPVLARRQTPVPPAALPAPVPGPPPPPAARAEARPPLPARGAGGLQVHACIGASHRGPWPWPCSTDGQRRYPSIVPRSCRVQRRVKALSRRDTEYSVDPPATAGSHSRAQQQPCISIWSSCVYPTGRPGGESHDSRER